MIHELLLEDLSLWSCVWQSTLVAVIGLIGSLFLRRRPARAFQVLFLAMVAAVVVPMMSVFVKHFELGMFTAEPIALQSETRGMSSTPYGASAILAEPDTQAELYERAMDISLAQGSAGNVNIPWRTILLSGWLVAALVLLIRLLVAFMKGILLLRRSQSQVYEHIRQAADIARAKLGINTGLQVRSSREIHSPMIWCWSKSPVLLVPRDLDNNVDWVGVICHELAHWRRWDHISGMIAEMIVCILSWNPLMWLAKKRLVRLGEQACDDWVVAGGQPVENYARSLLNFKPQKQAAFVPAVVNSKKGVAVRIRRILKYSCGNPRTGLLWASTASIMVTCIAVGIAFAQTRPVKPEAAAKHQDRPNESLQRAAAKGDIEQVRLLISKGADVNARDEKGMTPLYYAARYGRKEVAELLISKGADVNVKEDRWGGTPLSWTAMGDHRDLAELLIANGANVNSKGHYGWTPLHDAAWGGARHVADLLLAKKADISAQAEKWAATPLHAAAYQGHKDVAELLIAKGADVNTKGIEGYTPLQRAASKGHRDVVELLLAKGAKISSFHLAACIGDLSRVRRFCDEATDVDKKDKLNWTPLNWAAFTGQRDVVEFLVAKGADVNARDGSRRTVLHYPTRTGHKEIVEVLLANGADVNARDGRWLTALHYAARNGHKGIVEVLLANGADINARGRFSKTPVELAMGGNQREVVELLVSKGADISPLCLAAYTGDWVRVKSLIENGADVNIRTQAGITSLCYVVIQGSKDIVQLLVDNGAEVNTKDNWNWTPLHSAAYKGHKDLTELLIDKGANVNAKDGGDHRPLWYAQDEGHTEIVELMLKHGAKE